MQKVDKEKTRYYLAKIHILFRGNFRTQEQCRGRIPPALFIPLRLSRRYFFLLQSAQSGYTICTILTNIIKRFD